MQRVGVECGGEYLIVGRRSGWRFVECGPLKIQSGQSNVGISCFGDKCPLRRTSVPDVDVLREQTREELGFLNSPPDWSSFLQIYQDTDRASDAFAEALAEPKATTAAELHVQVVVNGMRFILPGEVGYPEHPEALPVYG